MQFQLKQMETTKMSCQYQVKSEKDKLVKVEKELDKLKTERAKWETKAQSMEAELKVSTRVFNAHHFQTSLYQHYLNFKTNEDPILTILKHF